MSENAYLQRLRLPALALLTVMAGCSSGEGTISPTPPPGTNPPATDAPTDAPTATRAQPTYSAAPTDPPTRAPTPTASMAPTATRVPTPEPTPTAVPVPTFELLRGDPEAGAWGVGVAREFVLAFNEPFPQGYDPYSKITLRLLPEGGGAPVVAQASALTEDSLGMRFSMSLSLNTAYTVEARVDAAVPAEGRSYDGWLTTRVPCGAGFDLAHDADDRPLNFTTFGNAGNTSLRSLNAGINGVPQDLVVLFNDVASDATLPIASFSMVAGSVSPVDDTNGWMDAATGFSASMNGCTVGGSGNLTCSAPLLVMPLNVTATSRKELANIYLRNASVTGQVANAGSGLEVTSLKLSGVVTQPDLEYFIDQAGAAVAGVLTPIINKGYDTSYGGEQAMSVVIEASPIPFVLNDCQI